MNFMETKMKWIEDYYNENNLDPKQDDIDMEELVEWLAKKQQKNISIRELLTAFGKSLQYQGVRTLTDEGIKQAIDDFEIN